MRYLLIILLFTSCVDVDFQVDSRLKPYFNQFVADAKEHGVTIDQDNMILKLKDLRSPGDNVIGLYDPAVVQKYVYIDSVTYFTKPGIVKLIIYHEMGHAFLHRGHNKNFSYMNPQETIKEENLFKIDSLNVELFQ